MGNQSLCQIVSLLHRSIIGTFVSFFWFSLFSLPYDKNLTFIIFQHSGGYKLFLVPEILTTMREQKYLQELDSEEVSPESGIEHDQAARLQGPQSGNRN